MNRRSKEHLDPAIERVRLGKLTIFEITEAELDDLERGSPESLFLNLCVAAVSIASSFLIALLTTTVDDIKTYCVLVIIVAIGFVASATFGLLWWRLRRSLKKVAREIRGRRPPEGLQESGTAETPDSQ